MIKLKIGMIFEKLYFVKAAGGCALPLFPYWNHGRNGRR